MNIPAIDTILRKPEIERIAEPDAERWNLLTFRADVCATMAFQFAYLLQAMQFGGQGGRLAPNLHLLLVGLPSLTFALTWNRGFQRRWRLVAMAMSLAVIGGMAVLSVISQEIIPLFVISILTLAGTCLLRWNEYWQAALSCYVLIAFAVVGALVPSSARYESLYWLGVLTGVGFAQIAVRLSNGYRRTLWLHLEELRSAQARSSQSEATMRQVLDAIPGLVVLTRLRDGKLLQVNQEFLERTGISREQVLSTSTQELGLYARPGDRASFTRKLKSEGGVRDLELDFRLNKSLVPYLVSAVVIDFQGEACTVSIGQDITKIRDSERALRGAQEMLNVQIAQLTLVQKRLLAEIDERKAAERIALERETTLRKIFEASPDHIAIRRLSDGHYLEINKQFSLTGYSREELIGKRPEDLNIFVDPAQYAELDERLRLEGQVRDVDVRLQHRDGRILDGLLSGTVVELRGEPCAISISRDISDRKQTERALRAAQQRLSTQIQKLSAAQERLRAEVAERKAAERSAKRSEDTLRRIFEATTDGLVIFSLRNGRIIEVNNEFCRVSGFSREELLNAPQGRIGTWAHEEQRRRFIHELKTIGVVRNMEIDMRSRDGTLSPFLLSSSVLELNREPCAVALLRDIAEIKEMERDLITAREAALAGSRAKSEFLSSMSHEIRTPMNAILGMAELLSETDLNSEQHRFLEVINANSAALLELINSILDLAKIESGRLQIEKTEFDLTDLVDKTISTFQVRAHSKKLELASRIVPGTPEYLIGDPLRLRQVLINLIGNALKFTEVGEVVLLIENDLEAGEPGCLRFTVSDSGIGLPPEKLDSIFSSFTQADASTSRKYGGTGLGLSISQRLVMLMGGRIWVESELGKGSRFIFTLPFGLASQVNTLSSVTLPDLNGIRILVVDNNATNRLIAREALESRGAIVTQATSGEETLETLRSATECGQQPQLILLDMRMPVMDGLEVARRIRHELRASEPLIMMLSSDDLKPELSRLRESGLNAYLVKPIIRNELFEAVSRALGEAKSTNGLPPEEAATTSTEKSNNLPSLSILVAEDMAVNRMLVSLFLAPLGWKLDFAENGREALEMFMRNRYNLVLMDIQMPVMDGYEATLEIRNWERAHNAPRTNVVALTASALTEDAAKAREAGCDAHITKPVKKEALLQAIPEYCSTPGLITQETEHAA